MILVVEVFDGRFLDGPVHPLDLPVRPGMIRFGERVLDVVGLADHIEAHLARPGGVAVARLLGELDAIVREDGVDAIRHGFQQVFEELPGCPSISLVDELRDRELAGAVGVRGRGARECQEFRVRAVITGTKETRYVPTQRARDTE